MHIIKARKQFILTLFLIFIGITALTQSLTGTTGLLRIPTANLESDKTLIIGASFLNKNLLAYSNYQYDAIAGYATLTFLPFLEVSIRYTRKIDMPRIEYETREFADRMPSFKLRLFNEKKYFPAIAVGGNDFISSIKDQGPHYFASYYAVMTKKMLTKNKKLTLEASIGHAFKLGNPYDYDILGVFGGLQIYLSENSWFSAMLDYDSQYWNVGMRLLLFKHLQIMPVLRNAKVFEGNIAYKIYL